MARDNWRSRYAEVAHEPLHTIVSAEAIVMDLRHRAQHVLSSLEWATGSGHKTYRTVRNELAFVKRFVALLITSHPQWVLTDFFDPGVRDP